MIRLKSLEDIQKLRCSGKILAAVFRHLEPFLVPGVSTWELDRRADEFIRMNGGIPSFYQYHGFPGHICTSVNEVVIHGVPSKKQILKDGDLITIDIGVDFENYFTDSAKTYGIGRLSRENHQLLQVTEQSLHYVIETLATPKKKGRLKDIGKAITEFIRPYGYGIVDSFCGHGVGFAVHEEPSIFHCYPSPGQNLRLKAGMVLAIEPMICLGSHKVNTCNDGFTVVSQDGKNAAHFEHSIVLYEDHIEILTI